MSSGVMEKRRAAGLHSDELIDLLIGRWISTARAAGWLVRSQLVASCSEDTTVKVWGIPEDGFSETETEALINLQGHGRKVTLLRFHPTANNVLAR